MDRRCTSESCLLLASSISKIATIDMPVANILHNPVREWRQLSRGGVRVAGRNMSIDWSKYNLDDYLWTHCTIVCSVKVANNGYYIESPCDELVNTNGNAWANQVLMSTFRTFIGGENYVEHIQVPELSKGKIFDAVIRPVKYAGKNGKEADVFYVDILIGTDKKHTDLVSKIASGSLTTLSMGCIVNKCTCSKCGNVTDDYTEDCEHLKNELGQYFTDENGVKRIVAELCGAMVKKGDEWVADPNSVKFIEASWVEKPAFEGAVLNHFISEVSASEKKAFAIEPNRFSQVFDLAKLRVADRTGMLVLRVAQAELARLKEQKIIENVMRGKDNALYTF
jgi:hypothetical protein